MTKPTKPFDDEFRLLTDVVVLFGYQLLHVNKDELLPQALKYLNSDALPLSPVELVSAPNSDIVTLSIGKLNNIINNLAQNADKMFQQSIDQLKALLRMDAGWQIKLPNGKVLTIFSPTKDYKHSKAWQQSVVRQINALVEYTRSNLKSPHVLAIVLLLVLVTYSVTDLYQIYNECKIMENLSKNEKEDFFNCLNDIVKVLTKICDDLNNRNIGRFYELLQTLIRKTTNLTKKIDKSKVEIEKRIRELQKEESDRTVLRNIWPAESLLAPHTFFWNTFNMVERAVGIFSGTTTAGAAIILTISANKLTQIQAKQKEVLNNITNLNKKLLDILEEVKCLKYEPINHEVLRIQFDGYKESLQEFQTLFK
ncbi:15891_t:CDS:2 [Funneliformis caledonium]|uniref:15891_t:CDS:1 n=1 Tax=Funneliformis caledonium TaxID=1117310 RepID=A0A9N9FLC3_9GLOM|nr:15891_t:CDS:2 [Funneliformis caledonium]